VFNYRFIFICLFRFALSSIIIKIKSSVFPLCVYTRSKPNTTSAEPATTRKTRRPPELAVTVPPTVITNSFNRSERLFARVSFNLSTEIIVIFFFVLQAPFSSRTVCRVNVVRTLCELVSTGPRRGRLHPCRSAARLAARTTGRSHTPLEIKAKRNYVL